MKAVFKRYDGMKLICSPDQIEDIAADGEMTILKYKNQCQVLLDEPFDKVWETFNDPVTEVS